jgi:hypothetical protein
MPMETKDVHFPRAGIDVERPFSSQPAYPSYQGQYARTTCIAVNVRSFDYTGRWRGGSRAGLDRYINARVGGNEYIVQCLESLTGAPYVEGTVQTSQAGRVVKVVAVSQGNVYTANAGDTSWTAATNLTGDSPPLNFSGTIFAAVNKQRMGFADGVNYCFYSPFNNTVNRLTATVGQLPVDSSGNKPRLIETWRGRTLFSGLLLDPQVLFMSKIDDPQNWEYGPQAASPADAVALTNSPLGAIGDIVTGMVPYSDNVLFIGGDHTLTMLNGDPADGGSVVSVSNSVGMAWGRAWCIGPDGTLFFMSNQMRFYAVQPGSKPQRISYGIDPLIETLNPGTLSVRLFWSEEFQGFHAFLTPLAAPAEATHYFFEQRSGAWWKDTYRDTDMNPLTGCIFDGNEPTDRRLLIGSWDGYVRSVSTTADTDDGKKIDTEVWIGPFVTPTFDDLRMNDIQAILDEASGDVDYAIFTGNTAQDALDSEPFHEGTWEAGKNLNQMVRSKGHATYIRLTSSVRWAMESIRLRLESQGKVNARGN